jgi:anti-sigma B factor antagonist
LETLNSGEADREADMKELEITQEQLPSTVLLHIAGAVDSNTAPELQEVLLRAAESPTGAVELDLAKVSYMSSAGLRALLLAAKALQKRGERLSLSSVPPQIRNVLNLTGFATFIEIKP